MRTSSVEIQYHIHTTKFLYVRTIANIRTERQHVSVYQCISACIYLRTDATKWYKSYRTENTQETVCSVRLTALENERCCSESARLAKCHWQLCFPLSHSAHTRWGVRHYTLSYVVERWIAKKSFGHEKYLIFREDTYLITYLLTVFSRVIFAPAYFAHPNF
jgi:hypothetical protein